MIERPQTHSESVVVVTGVGGMGKAIARRLGSGTLLVIADVDQGVVEDVAAELAADGHRVHPYVVDVTSPDAMHAFATHVQGLGNVIQIVHTAGVSPNQASAARILEVDLLGVVLMLDEFAHVIAEGGAGVVIASMAGHLIPALPDKHRHAIVTAEPSELLKLPFLDPANVADAGLAYAVAKQAVLIRVRASAVAWGQRKARINSLSPGTIATPMGRHELASPLSQMITTMIDTSPAGRQGTPEDIATAAAFLLNPTAGFITGADLLVDGGVTAAAHDLAARG